MWATESGNRVLRGAERRLFVHALNLLVSLLEEFERTDNEVVTGVHLFDSLEIGQKLAMLDQVANALLRSNIPAPKLTAVREATVGAIYRFLPLLVEVETEEGGMNLRPLIAAAAAEREIGDIPAKSSRSLGDWEEVIEQLSMEILWDTDWDLPPEVLDLSPARRRKFASAFDIDVDYFADVAPDPTPAELKAVTKRLKAIARGK